MKLYVEGGGDSESLRSRCREGYSVFLRKAGLEGSMPRIVACGGRGKAIDRFCTAVRNGETAYLLVDSEETVMGTSVLAHLRRRDPEAAAIAPSVVEDQCHLMVTCMETWFLADKKSLAEYFGQGFDENALPVRSDIENLPRHEVIGCLERSTTKSKSKGAYSKGEHSFMLLGRIDPGVVVERCPWANRFVSKLISQLKG